MLSSEFQLLWCNPVVWLCDPEPVRTFNRGPPPGKAKLRRWWTYLSQLRLSVHHIEGVKNECADYISRNNFDDIIGASSEELAKEAVSRMDVHPDLNMTMIRPVDGLQQVEYCFRSMVPYLCRSGKKISNLHNLQFDKELSDFTTCRAIFHQECLKITPPGKSGSKYL